MGGFDWASINKAACLDFHTTNVRGDMRFLIVRRCVREFMYLAAGFYFLVNGLRASIYWIGGVISDVYPRPLRFLRRRRVQGWVDEFNFVLVKSNWSTVLVEGVEVAFSYLENGKHLTDFDLPL